MQAKSNYFTICLYFLSEYVWTRRTVSENREELAAACTLYKAVAVSTLGNSGVAFVSSYRDTAERAVILCYHIVLALRNSTSDAIVFLLVIHIHNEQLLFFYCCVSNNIMACGLKKYSRIKILLGEIIIKKPLALVLPKGVIMSIILIRSLILYIIVVSAVRLMGKRQLGEMQPSELVITILISNIATLPLEDTDIPVIIGITPILALVCYEVFVSWLILRLPFFRKIIYGSPKIIISNGKINRSVLRELRLSVDDIMTAMRTQQIFDISEVQFAIVETTGSISAIKKQTKDTPDREDLRVDAVNTDPPQVVVSDGKILPVTLKSMGYNERFVENSAKKAGLEVSDIFIMTADGQGKVFISPKNEKKSPYSSEKEEQN